MFTEQLFSLVIIMFHYLLTKSIIKFSSLAFFLSELSAKRTQYFCGSQILAEYENSQFKLNPQPCNAEKKYFGARRWGNQVAPTKELKFFILYPVHANNRKAEIACSAL